MVATAAHQQSTIAAKTSSSVAVALEAIKQDLVESHRRHKTSLESVASTFKKLDHHNQKPKPPKRELSEEAKIRRASGLLRPVLMSEELCAFLNLPSGSRLPRTEVVKRIAEYVRVNNLQFEGKRTEFDLSRTEKGVALANLLDVHPTTRVSYFSMNTYLNRHLKTVKPDGTINNPGLVSVPSPADEAVELIDTDLNTIDADQ